MTQMLDPKTAGRALAPLESAQAVGGLLRGKKGLVVGMANEHSLAFGCARAFCDQGAQLAVTYQNDKAYPFVRPLAQRLEAALCMPLDVTQPDQQAALFEAIAAKWGKLDFLLHSVAFAPKADLQGRVVDCSREGFSTAMDVSCHSLIRLAHAAEPLMKDGGSILTMSFYGAEKVVTNYNLMGPVKAALEASMKYLAVELGPRQIRVNALSTGPVKTRAASGLADFDVLMEEAARRAPLHQLVRLEQVGEMAAFMVSDGARQVTGQTIFIDAGYNVRA